MIPSVTGASMPIVTSPLQTQARPAEPARAPAVTEKPEPAATDWPPTAFELPGVHSVPGPPPAFEVRVLEYLRLVAEEPPSLTEPDEGA